MHPPVLDDLGEAGAGEEGPPLRLDHPGSARALVRKVPPGGVQAEDGGRRRAGQLLQDEEAARRNGAGDVAQRCWVHANSSSEVNHNTGGNAQARCPRLTCQAASHTARGGLGCAAAPSKSRGSQAKCHAEAGARTSHVLAGADSIGGQDDAKGAAQRCRRLLSGSIPGLHTGADQDQRLVTAATQWACTCRRRRQESMHSSRSCLQYWLCRRKIC